MGQQTFKVCLFTSLTFKGDERTLSAARIKINEEFKKNKHVKNEGSIDELVKMAKEVEVELKANVIQAKEKEPGLYGKTCRLFPNR